MFDLHLRRSMLERYYCGGIAKEKYPDHVVNVVEKGVPVLEELLPELIIDCFRESGSHPGSSPVVILEPPGVWNDDIRARVAAPFLRQLRNPFIAYLSSAVAILAG